VVRVFPAPWDSALLLVLTLDLLFLCVPFAIDVFVPSVTFFFPDVLFLNCRSRRDWRPMRRRRSLLQGAPISLPLCLMPIIPGARFFSSRRLSPSILQSINFSYEPASLDFTVDHFCRKVAAFHCVFLAGVWCTRFTPFQRPIARFVVCHSAVLMFFFHILTESTYFLSPRNNEPKNFFLYSCVKKIASLAFL